MAFLRKLHPEFDGMGTSAMSDDKSVVTGRPLGGVGVMWRKGINAMCNVKLYDDARLIGLDVNANGDILSFINVYLPYQ